MFYLQNARKLSFSRCCIYRAEFHILLRLDECYSYYYVRLLRIDVDKQAGVTCLSVIIIESRQSALIFCLHCDAHATQVAYAIPDSTIVG